MANVLSNAIKKTIRLGRGGEEKSFHIAFTGTADYISHMGVVALSVRKWNPDMPLSFHFNCLISSDSKALSRTFSESA